MVHARGRGQLIDGDLIVFQPLRIRLSRGEPVLDLFVGDDAAFDCVYQEHFSRLQATFHLYLFGLDVEHAGFRGHDDVVIVCHHVASGAEAIAIEDRTDHSTVGECYGRWAVPRFHQASVIFVEGALLRLHVRIAGPGFRHQHGHGVRQTASRLQEQFDGVVEIRGIATIGRDDGKELLYIVAKQRRPQQRLACVHPVDVALERVDLAVVRDVAIGMRTLPTGECVRRKALVDQAQRAGHVRIGKLFIEVGNLRSQQQAFVHNGAARE